MAIRTEISLRLPNTPGELARVCDHLSRDRVNLVALHLETNGRLRLLVENPLHAAAILREHRYEIDERDVLYVLLSNSPGGAAGALQLLAVGEINIEYAYAAAVEGAPMAALVVGVADAQRASAVGGW